MKKVGVTTLSNSTNYGGILQAVALSTVLKKMNYEPTFIKHQKMMEAWISPVSYVKNRVRLYGCAGFKTKLRIAAGFMKTILQNIQVPNRMRKIESFQKFIHENLKVTDYYESLEELNKNCSDYDFYITGSDQVWNNAFTKNEFDTAYFLKFVNEKPKYSYAASAGGKKSDEYVKSLVELTKDFKGISVREKSLEEHMKKMGCEKVMTVLDPTLLLSKEDWIGMEKKPQRGIPEKYILVYYLEKDASRDEIIKTAAKKLGLPVVNIFPNGKKAEYESIDDYIAGPGEFIYYFHNAEYVITNSFHATVFSLIFGKKFLATARDGQESRIEDLLNTVKMKERLVKSEKQWEVLLEDVNDTADIFEAGRAESLEFLRSMGN